jgi:hypothetical protein
MMERPENSFHPSPHPFWAVMVEGDDPTRLHFLPLVGWVVIKPPVRGARLGRHRRENMGCDEAGLTESTSSQEVCGGYVFVGYTDKPEPQGWLDAAKHAHRKNYERRWVNPDNA